MGDGGRQGGQQVLVQAEFVYLVRKDNWNYFLYVSLRRRMDEMLALVTGCKH